MIVIQFSVPQGFIAFTVGEVHSLKIIADLYLPPALFMHQMWSSPWSVMPAISPKLEA